MLQNGDQLGVLLAEVALGLWAALTTALAFVARIRLRRAEAMRSDAERKKNEAEAAAQEAATALVSVTADRDHWREQSMRPFPRPPGMPTQLGALPILEGRDKLCDVATAATGGAFRCTRVAGHEGPCAAVPVTPPGLEGDEDSEGTRYADLPAPATNRPEQFAEEPTDPQKRKPS